VVKDGELVSAADSWHRQERRSHGRRLSKSIVFCEPGLLDKPAEIVEAQ